MPCHNKPIREAENKQRQESRPAYSGGLGAGKEWLQTDFLISPEEFRTLLSRHQIKLFITNNRVEISYRGTSVDDYVSDYSKYLDFMFSGKEFDPKGQIRFADATYMSVFINTDDIQVEEFVHNGDKFKMVLLDKPPIRLSPCMISWSGKALSLCTWNEQGYIGLSLQYPKVYFSSKDDFTREISTHGSMYHNLYSAIVADLRVLCRTHRFIVDNKTVRPKLLISDSCMANVNRHWYLCSKGISVI